MPVPSESIRTMITLAVGKTYDDDTQDLYWDDASDLYSDNRIIRQAVIVELLRLYIAEAGAEVDYQLNEEKESLSQKAKALLALLKTHEGVLDSLIADSLGAVRIGVSKRVPSRRKEYPDD